MPTGFGPLVQGHGTKQERNTVEVQSPRQNSVHPPTVVLSAMAGHAQGRKTSTSVGPPLRVEIESGTLGPSL